MRRWPVLTAAALAALLAAGPALAQMPAPHAPCLVETADPAAIVAAFEAEGWTHLTDPDAVLTARQAAGQIVYPPMLLLGELRSRDDVRQLVQGATEMAEQRFRSDLVFGRADVFAIVEQDEVTPGRVRRECIMAGLIFPEVEAYMAANAPVETSFQVAFTVWMVEPPTPTGSIDYFRIEAPGLSSPLLSARLGIVVFRIIETDQ